MDTLRARDFAVNTAMALAAVGVGLTSDQNILLGNVDRPTALRVADLVFGTVCLAGIWIWRRSHPVVFAVAAVAVGVFSTLAGGVGLICAFTVAEYRSWRTAVGVSIFAAVSILPALELYPVPHEERSFFVGALATFAATGWGMFVRARRQLIDSMQRRLREAEQAATERAVAARRGERQRIAREMHDVLAHRLSLLAVHAGALEFHHGATADEITTAAGIIRSNTHEALNDLREVIDLLRESTPDSERPQPTLTDLSALLEESTAAGLTISADVSAHAIDTVDRAPASIGRTIYRVVQESLTNVRKHAPQAHVRVEVHESDDGIDVSIHNQPSLIAPSLTTPQGSGTGLSGVRERVSLAGGHVDFQPTADQGFRVHAWLPCAAAGQGSA